MSYHSSSSSSARQSSTNRRLSAARSTVNARPTVNARSVASVRPVASIPLVSDKRKLAPPGFHYMPNGSLMSNAAMSKRPVENYYNPYEKGIASSNTYKHTIKKLSISTENIAAAGEQRIFSIIGDRGASFSLQIKNGAGLYYNFITN